MGKSARRRFRGIAEEDYDAYIDSLSERERTQHLLASQGRRWGELGVPKQKKPKRQHRRKRRRTPPPLNPRFEVDLRDHLRQVQDNLQKVFKNNP